MATVSDIVEYYTNLLIIQYNQKPKMRAVIGAVVEQALANNLAFDVRDAFDLETATGVQLDTIGKYVGVDRFYRGQEFDGDFFAFVTYTEDTPVSGQEGFAEYSNFETKEGSFLKYEDVVNSGLSLSDEDYRVLIKLKIVQNNINHSHKEIDDSLFDFFGEDLRANSDGDMVMDYFVPRNLSSLIQVAIEKEVLPKPMGVGIRYLIRTEDSFFGFATYNSEDKPLNAGFTTYSEFDTADGEVLTYNKLLEI